MPKIPPWADCPYTEQECAALKSLAAGKANEGQQRRALNWIINQAAKTYDQQFIPASDRETTFLLGRRFVGLQIVKLINLDISVFQKDKTHG